MKPKFTCSEKSETRLYVSPEWFSNGHWMLARSAVALCASQPVNRELKPAFEGLLKLRNGRYDPVLGFDENYPMPDFSLLIPRTDTFDTMAKINSLPTHALIRPDTLDVFTMVLVGTWHDKREFQMGIQAKYAPLLFMCAADTILVKDEKAPFVLVGPSRDVVAVIMGVRLPEEFPGKFSDAPAILKAVNS